MLASHRDTDANARDRTAEKRDTAAGERDLSASERDAVALLRDVHGADRDTSASLRDAEADGRDQAAERRDHAADAQLVGSPTTARPNRSGRARAATDRRQAATDRMAAAVDRMAAAVERGAAAVERAAAGASRAAAAADRLVGAAGRDWSQQDRTATDGDRADQAQRESRLTEDATWIRQLLESMPDPLIVTNDQGIIELVNAQSVLLFGYQAEELVGQPVERLIPAGLHDVHRRRSSTYVSTDQPRPMSTGADVRAFRRDGSSLPVEVNLSTISLAGGRAVLASIRDISARRRAEVEQRISDERFGASFDWAPSGMALIDLHGADVGRLLRVNPAFCRLSGYTEAEMLATTCVAITHPEDRADTAANLERLSDGRTPESWETDKRYLRKSGQGIWVHFAILVVHDAEGRPAYGVSQVEDITDRRSAEALQQQQFQALADNVNAVFMLRRLDPPEFLYVSPAYWRMFGYAPDTPMPTPTQSLASVHPADLEQLSTVLDTVAHGQKVDLEWRFTRQDGQLRWASGSLSPIPDPDGQIRRVAIVYTDITDRKHDEITIRDSEARFQLLARTIAVGFFLAEPATTGAFVYLSPAIFQIFGLDQAADPPTVTQLLAMRHPGDETSYDQVGATQEQRASFEVRIIRPDGTVRWTRHTRTPISDDDGNITLIAGTVEDVNDRRIAEAAARAARAEAEMSRELALHDALTGLPNGILMVELLEHALHRSQRTTKSTAVLYLDLDGFKTVNDTYGHAVGDQLLVAVADRLSHLVRPSDTVARLHGDEFVILCEDLESPQQATDITRRLLAAIAEPFILDTFQLQIGISIGTVVADHQRHDPDQLLREADAAMYEAKRQRSSL